MTEFVLVRHGETDWNASGRLHGSLDIPLNEHGKAQAQALGLVLAREQIDAIYSSPQSRARATAAIIALATGRNEVEVIVTEDLRERDFGDAEGTSLSERRTRWPDKQWPNAESADSMYNRVRQTLSLLTQQPAQHLMLVTHGSWIRSALRIASGFDPDVMNISVPNGSATRMWFDGDAFEIIEIGVMEEDRGIHD